LPEVLAQHRLVLNLVEWLLDAGQPPVRPQPRAVAGYVRLLMSGLEDYSAVNGLLGTMRTVADIRQVAEKAGLTLVTNWLLEGQAGETSKRELLAQLDRDRGAVSSKTMGDLPTRQLVTTLRSSLDQAWAQMVTVFMPRPDEATLEEFCALMPVGFEHLFGLVSIDGAFDVFYALVSNKYGKESFGRDWSLETKFPAVHANTKMREAFEAGQEFSVSARLRLSKIFPTTFKYLDGLLSSDLGLAEPQLRCWVKPGSWASDDGWRAISGGWIREVSPDLMLQDQEFQNATVPINATAQAVVRKKIIGRPKS
jgi:hypothetical protein